MGEGNGDKDRNKMCSWIKWMKYIWGLGEVAYKGGGKHGGGLKGWRGWGVQLLILYGWLWRWGAFGFRAWGKWEKGGNE